MPVVLGINVVFHDPAAALIVDGRIAAAAEEERYSRRKHGKHGKDCVPFATCLFAIGVDEVPDAIHELLHGRYARSTPRPQPMMIRAR